MMQKSSGDQGMDADVGTDEQRMDASPNALVDIVVRVMSLVPPAVANGAGSTWVERRTAKFDMKSAYGSGR